VTHLVHAIEDVRVKEPIVCVGNFDGVHLGHRMLLERMRELAQRERRPGLVVTFFPPAKVVFGHATFLSSAEEKLDLLEAFAPDTVVMIPFDREYARTDKAHFVDELRRLAPHTIIVGEDFRFGHQRAGGLNDLSPIAGKLEAFGLRTFEGEVVKSSHVREHLKEGRIERANALLGAPYRARGRVQEGQRRGRSIGFPTANVVTDPKKALPVGVFAVTVEVGGVEHRGMANVGPRPSFPEEPPSLEVHLFDFDGELYGETITTAFHALLRGQMRFASLDELQGQLRNDEAGARAALAALDAPPERSPRP
jgi:riboflavin kinase / FMN adenylyltransferase